MEGYMERYELISTLISEALELGWDVFRYVWDIYSLRYATEADMKVFTRVMVLFDDPEAEIMFLPEVLLGSSDMLYLSIDFDIDEALMAQFPRTLLYLSLLPEEPLRGLCIPSLPPVLECLILHVMMDRGLIGKLPRTLKYLELHDYIITPTEFIELPRGLKSLTVGSCSLVNEELSKDSPPALEHLEFKNVSAIGDTFIKNLPRSLRSLILNGHNTITDAGLSLLQNLHTLVLCSNINITAQGLYGLPHTLTSLELREVSQIDDLDVTQFPPGLIRFDLGAQEHNQAYAVMHNHN